MMWRQEYGLKNVSYYSNVYMKVGLELVLVVSIGGFSVTFSTFYINIIFIHL